MLVVRGQSALTGLVLESMIKSSGSVSVGQGEYKNSANGMGRILIVLASLPSM